jgi:hypothetical protein
MVAKADLDEVSGDGVDTIKCALLTNAHSFDTDHNEWGEISANEASGAGYTTGGAIISNLVVTQDNVNNKAVFDADDVTWSSSTITAKYAVLYDVTQGTNLIACFDFGSDYSSSNGNFTVQWNASGIITLS